MSEIHYSGDQSIEHGGFYYSLENWQYDYVDAVRLTPTSDAGGPDNVFWIERLTVNIQKGEKLNSIQKFAGFDEKGWPEDPEELKHALVWGHVGYGSYDADPIETLQVGPKDPLYGGREKIEPTKVVRSNTNLRKRLINYLKGDMNG